MYCVENLTQQTVRECDPWTFVVGEISDEVRQNKLARQTWYRSPTTKHSFYTGFCGVNPSVRIGAENPPHSCTAFVVDIDHTYSHDDIKALANALPVRPRWLEQSLSQKKWRLVFLLSAALRVVGDSKVWEEFMTRLLEKLGLTEVQGLDKAWFKPAQLYANGGVWEDLGGEPVPVAELETLLFKTTVAVCKQSRSKEVQLARIAEMIKRKWPEWEWPGDFVEGSLGPSWWVEGSTSPKSASPHPAGIFTFASHAEKTFYTWDELLGAGCVEKDRQEHIDNSIGDYFTDGKEYFQARRDGGKETVRLDALRRILVGVHGLGAERSKKQKQSEVDEAIMQIDTRRRVDYAAPFVYRPPGQLIINGKTYLNTLELHPMEPAAGAQLWGPHGNFPFISDWLDRVFVEQQQLRHHLAWFCWAYANALTRDPRQGQCGFLAGFTNIGKSYWGHILGKAMGGFVDPVRYLTDGDAFGGHLFEYGWWCIDDQTMVADAGKLRAYTGAIKRMIANPSQEWHMKYRMPTSVEWLGRIFGTLNLDAWSSIVLPTMEDSVADKICFWRWVNNPLPNDYFKGAQARVDKELASFLRYVLDTGVEEFSGDVRFGVTSFQDPQMRQTSYLNSGSAPMYETIALFLDYHTAQFGRDSWTGPTAQLLADMCALPSMSVALRGVTLQNLTRHLTHMESMGNLGISSRMDEREMRVWTIKWRAKQ
jgi:hypothetical protein